MKKFRTFFFTCGILMAASEIWKQLTLTFRINHGAYDWWYFPFQLCSIPMYICLILPVISNKKYPHLHQILLTFLMDYCLLAGIFAFFDTSGMHYDYAPLTLHSFLWHILMILIGITAGLTRQADYSLSGYLGGTLLYVGLCGAATLFNLTLCQYGDLNMFYISPHYPMTQVVFSEITKQFGNSIGIWSYLLSIPVGAGVFHMMWKKWAK